MSYWSVMFNYQSVICNWYSCHVFNMSVLVQHLEHPRSLETAVSGLCVWNNDNLTLNSVQRGAGLMPPPPHTQVQLLSLCWGVFEALQAGFILLVRVCFRAWARNVLFVPGHVLLICRWINHHYNPGAFVCSFHCSNIRIFFFFFACAAPVIGKKNVLKYFNIDNAVLKDLEKKLAYMLFCTSSEP